MSYEEQRVRTKDFGTLAADSPLLVPVPTVPGHPQQRLHVLAAEGLERLSAASKGAMGIELLVASGWRPHRWSSIEQYEATLVRRYGSIAHGKMFLAFDSPHETGLAMDLSVGGLEPRSATRDQQQRTPMHAWLVEHAWEHGWHPYKVEPWHWECPVSLESYKAGSAGG